MGTRVYIGHLSYHAREKDVERFFKGYGHIRDIMLKNGYGFVEFDDYRDAEDAVYELNGRELCGEKIMLEHARGPSRRGWDSGYSSRSRRPSWLDKVQIEHAKGALRGSDMRGYRGSFPPRRRSRASDKYGPPTRTENRLIVENLSSRVSWQDLKDYMRQAGEVTYADAHKQHKNEGVVEFATYRDLKNALEKLDGTEINGKRIKLVEDRPRSRSRRSRSRSRSRSHSRSRSRSRSRRSRSRSSGSRSPSRSRSRSDRSRSASRSKSRSRSRSVDGAEKKASQSRSRSKSQGKSYHNEEQAQNGDSEKD